ncbi:glycosyltransferase family 1 protein [Tepidiforma sp.]|uniref:glycosyltransferase family 4 protein n=1 Tax=Tepidiforma sp. TaxID=2682230 RepID=UPI002ADDF12B|nr:glycosyltransferase family 1 protein [Tepidiforma sp.]
MRILLATDSFPPKIDGVSDTAATVAGTLARLGHDVCVLAPAPGVRDVEGSRVLRVESVPAPLYPELRLGVGLDRVIRAARRRWDGAIVLTPGPIGAAAALALRREVPMVHVYTTDIPRYLKAYGLHGLAGPAAALLRRMAARSVRTLCPTEFVRRELEASGFPRLEVWGRGVDTGMFRPSRRSAEMRARLSGGEPEAPIVLYVGRLAREKRLDVLADVADALPGARLALVGDGPERAGLERLLAGRRAVFTGYLRGVELAEAFASADVFVFPSTTDTFGQVVLQAMAGGVPPVVVTGSAPAEFVPAGVCGLHAAPGRPEAVVAAVRRLVEDPALRVSMGIAAAEWARRFSWDALVQRLLELLDPSRAPGAVEVPAGVAK